MKHVIVSVCGAIALLAAPAIALAQYPVHADSPKATLSVSQPLTVGNTLLPVGEYTFECRHIGDTEMLVVTNTDTHKEVARVPCKPQTLVSKVLMSEFHITTVDGARKLRSLRIKGEAVEHVIVTD